MLNRIAVTNPSIDKRTPNMQQALPLQGWLSSSIRTRRPHGDGAPYDGNPRKNQDILRARRCLITFRPQLGV
jgi:hypothetical protein